MFRADDVWKCKTLCAALLMCSGCSLIVSDDPSGRSSPDGGAGIDATTGRDSGPPAVGPFIWDFDRGTTDGLEYPPASDATQSLVFGLPAAWSDAPDAVTPILRHSIQVAVELPDSIQNSAQAVPLADAGSCTTYTVEVVARHDPIQAAAGGSFNYLANIASATSPSQGWMAMGPRPDDAVFVLSVPNGLQVSADFDARGQLVHSIAIIRSDRIELWLNGTKFEAPGSANPAQLEVSLAIGDSIAGLGSNHWVGEVYYVRILCDAISEAEVVARCTQLVGGAAACNPLP